MKLFSPRTSSIIPEKINIVEEIIKNLIELKSSTKALIITSTIRKIIMPPILGIILVWILLPPGWSTILDLRKKEINGGVRKIVKIKLVKNISK